MNFLDSNQAFLDFLGYSKEELLNLTAWDVISKSHHDIAKKAMEEQIMVRGYSDEFELDFVRKNGELFPVSIRVWIMMDENGPLIKFQGEAMFNQIKNELEESTKAEFGG